MNPPDAGEFSKIFKIFIKKIAKDSLFCLFSKNVRNPELIFRAFGGKILSVGQILKMLIKIH